MRYHAPTREAVVAEVWQRPPLDVYFDAYPWLADATWPPIERLNELLDGRCHAVTGQTLRFVTQTPALLKDRLHYEQRSFEQAAISTRADNWHDLFNALIWIRHTGLKSALNARYAAELRVREDNERSRPQMAITHFDEGGAIVLVQDPTLMTLWDRHDWAALFFDQRDAWDDGRLQLIVFGHATLEHALLPDQLITAKCIALDVSRTDPETIDPTALLDALATRIVNGELLHDPQELRPLPLSGIPGWRPECADRAFYLSADCFRPVRAGRTYPPAYRIL